MVLVSDEIRLRQIISNRVSNALKYTETGRVTLAASVAIDAPGFATLKVADTGVGIDEKFLERIFLPHVRLENTASSRSEGSGLGPTIVERLVASRGGSLKVESQLKRGRNSGSRCRAWSGNKPFKPLFHERAGARP